MSWKPRGGSKPNASTWKWSIRAEEPAGLGQAQVLSVPPPVTGGAVGGVLAAAAVLVVEAAVVVVVPLVERLFFLDPPRLVRTTSRTMTAAMAAARPPWRSRVRGHHCSVPRRRLRGSLLFGAAEPAPRGEAALGAITKSGGGPWRPKNSGLDPPRPPPPRSR